MENFQLLKRIKKRIQYVDKVSNEKEGMCYGFSNPGWYYSNDNWDYIYGPYDSEDLAILAFKEDSNVNVGE